MKKNIEAQDLLNVVNAQIEVIDKDVSQVMSAKDTYTIPEYEIQMAFFEGSKHSLKELLESFDYEKESDKMKEKIKVQDLWDVINAQIEVIDKDVRKVRSEKDTYTLTEYEIQMVFFEGSKHSLKELLESLDYEKAQFMDTILESLEASFSSSVYSPNFEDVEEWMEGKDFEEIKHKNIHFIAEEIFHKQVM